MARINFSDSVSNVDPGDYLLTMVLKAADGTVIGQGPDAAVTVPPPADVPVFDPPSATVTP